MIRSTAVTLFLLALLLGSCAPSTRSSSGRLPDLQPPVVSVAPQAATISSFDPPGTGSRLLVTVPVTLMNPNPFPVQIHGLDYFFSLGSGPAGLQPVREETRLMLLPGGSQQVALGLQRDLQHDNQLLSQAAGSFPSGSLAFNISGSIEYSSDRHPWISSSQFSQGGRAGTGAGVLPPSLSLPADAVSTFSLDGSSVVVRVVLEVHNPGTAGWLLHAKDLRLELAGEPMALQDLPPTPVPAGSTVQAAITFEPSAALLSQTARSVLSDALAGLPTRVAISGDLAFDVLGLDSFRVPGGLFLESQLHSD